MKECEEKTGAVKDILCLKRITQNSIDVLGSLQPNLVLMVQWALDAISTTRNFEFYKLALDSLRVIKSQSKSRLI